ncbi:MAG: hypothetical protein ABI809_00610 [Caldimonas sp.]
MILDISAAALAGFLLPYSWLAGLFSRWWPGLRFEWKDYLQMWEYDGRGQRFWSWFGAGFVLSVTVAISLVVKVLAW